MPSPQPSSLPSEVPSKLPSELPSVTPSPQPSSLPSNEPSEVPTGMPTKSPNNETEEVTPDDLTLTLRSNTLIQSQPVYESNCNEINPPQKKVDEFELSFIYAVESMQPNYAYIDDLEDWILYYVAKATLYDCSVDKSASQFLRSNAVVEDDHVADEVEFSGVVKVRYPQDGHGITVRTSECDPTSSVAKGCAVWSTRLVLSTVELSVPTVHGDMLQLLSDSLNNGTFVEYIPDLISTAYLGPNPVALAVQEDIEVANGGTFFKEGMKFVLFVSIVFWNYSMV